MIIDVHTHIFSQKIAAKAVEGLEKQYGVKACGEATAFGITSGMERSKVDKLVLLSVATRPEQVGSINNWLSEISKANPFFIGHGALAYVFPVQEHEHISVDRIMQIMEAYGFDRIFFGTDYLFRDQALEAANIMDMDIAENYKSMILGSKAAVLFDAPEGSD